MKYLFYIIITILALSCTTNTTESYDVYLCIGQSNMAGRGDIDSTVTDTLENVYLLTAGDTTWEAAANPMNRYSTIRKGLKMQQVGPSYGFGKIMASLDPNKKIGLVVNAKGGSSINEWHPDSLFFKEAVQRTQMAMKHGGQLKGIIWHQGCSDAGRWDAYTPKLEEMVAALRAELGQADLPFVCGQLSSDRPSRNKFNAMILNVPQVIPHSAVVTSQGLTTKDKTHFDAKSQLILGERYAKKMIELIK